MTHVEQHAGVLYMLGAASRGTGTGTGLALAAAIQNADFIAIFY
jgi:hypothetical protein